MLETALEMLGREAVFLTLLGLLGAGPAAQLPAPVPGAARLAAAPAFGLALGAAAMLSASELMAMNTAAYAVLLPLCALSVAAAVLTCRRAGDGRGFAPSRGGGLALAGVTLVLAISLILPLADARSPGPLGYAVPDAPTYAQVSGILQEHSWGDETLGPPWDKQAVGFRALLDSDFFQTTGSTPLPAAVSSVAGWEAIDTQSAFIATAVLCGALAAFAAALALTALLWPALLAGLLYGGPLTYQLFIDGSQSALSGLAIALAAGLIGVLLVRDRLSRTPGVLAALAILFAGLMPTYPLLVPPLTAAAALVLAVLGARRLARGERPGSLAWAAAGSAAVAVLAIALSPLGFERSLGYWEAVGAGLLDQPLAASFGVSGDGISTKEILPDYDLPADVLPGWLLGTREFYGLGSVTGSAVQVLLGLLAPLALLALAGFGLLRNRPALVIAAIIPVAAAQAIYASGAEECSYCVQRSLLPVGGVAPVLLGVGLAALAAAGTGPWMRRGAVAAGIVLVGVAARETSVMAQRAIEGGYVLPEPARTLVEAGSDRAGTLQLEGPYSSAEANLEYPSLYALIAQSTDRRISYLPDGAALSGARPRGPGAPFDPGYREVLTRLGGVATPRRTLARGGPYALQRRSGPLDVTVGAGVTAEPAKRDPSGAAWVSGPLALVLAGPGPAVLRIDLAGPAAAGAKAGRGRFTERGAGRATLCVPVSGAGPVRLVAVPLQFSREPIAPPPEEYGLAPVPGKSLRLAGVAAHRPGEGGC